MTNLTLEELIIEHYTLLETKRDLEYRIRTNQRYVAKVMADQGNYEMLTVNWAEARRIIQPIP